MRYLVGFAFVLALVAVPQGVNARDAEESTSPEPTVEEPPRLAFLLIPKHLKERLPRHRHVGSEPESKFSLEYQDQKSPEEAHAYRRFHQARKVFYGFSAAGGAFIGVGAMVLGLSYYCIGEEGEPGCPELPDRSLFNVGLILMGVGAAAMIVSGAVYGVRKRQLRELQQAHHGKPRRLRWDLAQSRFVF